MTRGTFVHNNEKNTLDDDELLGLLLFFCNPKKKPQDNNEFEGLLLSSPI
jgi:hypothetical protein